MTNIANSTQFNGKSPFSSAHKEKIESPINDIKPIFVLGSPRSGSTLIGSFIGTMRDVCDFGEYPGHFIAYHQAPLECSRLSVPFADEYISKLEDVATSFASDKCKELGKKFFLDSNQWNILHADKLNTHYEHAVNVVMIRHFSGLIQSLERSYRDGFSWAGSNIEERADLYNRIYKNIDKLPENTIYVSYDKLCSDPKTTIDKLSSDLKNVGVIGGDIGVFAQSHASNPMDKRKCIAFKEGDGSIVFSSKSSFDSSKWSSEDDGVVSPLIAESLEVIQKVCPESFSKPDGYTEGS